MDRSYIINYIGKKINAKSYLEVGVCNGKVFRSIQIDNKVGIDPAPTSSDIIPKTSDEFFRDNTQKFDLIFVDGLHEREQCKLDIENSLKILNEGGIILAHDMLPFSEQMQYPKFYSGMWTGDVWKTIVDLRSTRDDLEIYTVDCDFGIAVIQKKESKPLKLTKELTYQNYLMYRKEWLNILSLSEFYSKWGDEDVLQSLLNHFVQYPEYPEINFELGVYYQNIGQTASAVSYYIRSAERTHDDLLKYEAMLRASMCFNSQGSRGNSVKGMIQHSIVLQPERPEGYYYLSRFYEQSSQWFDGYLISSLGEKNADKNPPPLRTQLDYPGFYGILFEKAVTSWWTGLCGESRDLFMELATKHPLDAGHRKTVKHNFNYLGMIKPPEYFISYLKTLEQEIEASDKNLNLYRKKYQNNLKHKFSGVNKIHRNYSEAYQDMFVLSMLNGKERGTFVEVGGGFPLHGNNTYLLESKFNWNGLSIDIERESAERYFQDRNCMAVNYDATQIDYPFLFQEAKLPKVIDYLQLDCDPPEITFEILQKIPFDDYKFATITYEHDSYTKNDETFKHLSRKYLTDRGYELVVSNVCSKQGQDFEDWYVHPELVSREFIDKLKNTDGTKKLPDIIFFK